MPVTIKMLLDQYTEILRKIYVWKSFKDSNFIWILCKRRL